MNSTVKPSLAAAPSEKSPTLSGHLKFPSGTWMQEEAIWPIKPALHLVYRSLTFLVWAVLIGNMWASSFLINLRSFLPVVLSCTREFRYFLCFLQEWFKFERVEPRKVSCSNISCQVGIGREIRVGSFVFSCQYSDKYNKLQFMLIFQNLLSSYVQQI